MFNVYSRPPTYDSVINPDSKLHRLEIADEHINTYRKRLTYTHRGISQHMFGKCRYGLGTIHENASVRLGKTIG